MRSPGKGKNALSTHMIANSKIHFLGDFNGNRVRPGIIFTLANYFPSGSMQLTGGAAAFLQLDFHQKGLIYVM